MAEIITGPFHMDEQGFLATIEELIERFDGYSSGKYLAELGKIHDEYGEIGSLSLFDEKVCELGKELFCSTSWVANLAWAMISFDMSWLSMMRIFLMDAVTSCVSTV